MRRVLLFSILIALTIGNLIGQRIKPIGIALVVHDIELAAKWYGQALEMKINKRMSFPEYDSLVIYFLKNPDFQIELLSKETSFPITDLLPTYNLNNEPLIGFSKLMFEVDDIQNVYERLAKIPVDVAYEITEDNTFNSIYFIVRDPDGNLIQFIKYR